MTRRFTLVVGLAVLLMAPAVAGAGQDGRSAWRRERAEIRRELRDAARERHRAFDALREWRLEARGRWKADRWWRSARDGSRREYREARREARRAWHEALR